RAPNPDGPVFPPAAIEKGAAAVVVESGIRLRLVHPSEARTTTFEFLVPDTEQALQNLASWARQKWGGRIVAAKRELIEGRPPDGVAVLNADDPRVAAFAKVHPGRSVTFGFSEAADVRAENVEHGAVGSRFRALGVDFGSPMPGRHSVMNLLAAIAVAHVFGISPGLLCPAVATFTAGTMRGQRTLHQGIVIWNDCYNSNPEAAQAMLDVLVETPAA